jgi:O-antigen/teichoic acid export membrane protein
MNETQPEQQSLKSQGVWILFAKITGFAISFLLPFLIVRLLTQEKVGVYRQAFQVIINAVAILPLGISMSAYYFLNRAEERRKSTILNILLFNFVVGGLVCAGLNLYPQLLGNIYQSDEMTTLAPKIGVVIWLWIFSTFLEVVAIANNEARIATVFIILAQLTKTVLMAGAVVLFASVETFMYAAMIQAALQIIVLLFYLKSRFPGFWREFDWRFFREQMFYAMPFGFAGILWTLQNDIHTYFVGNRFSEAEYAIYTSGCFQLPMLSMLVESAGVVLISRISELQARGDTREIITLTARAMQKLSFFYFPAYVFLFVTATVFITTLFTDKYAASVPIFLINLTLLPFDIWVIDPIIRAYKEFGRFLIVLRVFILIGLVTALWFGVQHFNLTGMISIVVITSLIERLISTTVLLRKLNVKWQDWRLLRDVGKTAIISLLAGIVTFFVYRQVREIMPAVGRDMAQMISSAPKKGLVDFVSGSLTLGISFAVFTPIYLFVMNYFSLIDEGEKKIIKNYLAKFYGKFGKRAFVINS